MQAIKNSFLQWKVSDNPIDGKYGLTVNIYKVTSLKHNYNLRYNYTFKENQKEWNTFFKFYASQTEVHWMEKGQLQHHEWQKNKTQEYKKDYTMYSCYIISDLILKTSW